MWFASTESKIFDLIYKLVSKYLMIFRFLAPDALGHLPSHSIKNKINEPSHSLHTEQMI